MNRRSSALMMNPCPTGAPPWTTWALTVDCCTNDGLMPDKNIATTMSNGHRLFAPILLIDIRSSSTCDCGLIELPGSRLPHRRSSATVGSVTMSSHVRAASPPRDVWLRALGCGDGCRQNWNVGVRLLGGEERRYSSLAGERWNVGGRSGEERQKKRSASGQRRILRRLKSARAISA